MMHLTIPNILTLIRLVFSPLVLPLLIVLFLPTNLIWIHAALAALFIFFALTDFFDGFLARYWNQTSTIGRVLDPIADKFLTCSTLIALLAIHRVHVLWVLLLVGRELWVMGLREAALEQKFAVPVSWLGKLKTIAQMSYLAVVIANPHWQRSLLGSYLNVYEVALLVVTLTLSLGSAWQYQRALFAKIQ
jgi:cardiolipin synthase